jgi:hypothetical protein
MKKIGAAKSRSDYLTIPERADLFPRVSEKTGRVDRRGDVDQGSLPVVNGSSGCRTHSDIDPS